MSCDWRGGPRTLSTTTDTNLDFVLLLKTQFCTPILDFEKSTEKNRVSDVRPGVGGGARRRGRGAVQTVENNVLVIIVLLKNTKHEQLRIGKR